MHIKYLLPKVEEVKIIQDQNANPYEFEKDGVIVRDDNNSPISTDIDESTYKNNMKVRFYKAKRTTNYFTH